MSVTTKLLDAAPPLPPWGGDQKLCYQWYKLGRSWINPETRTRQWYTGYPDSTPIPTWSYDEKLAFWRKAQKREQRKIDGPRVTTKRKSKRTPRVTTKTYTRFNPHPRKYASNAERQAAYRKRRVTTKTT